MYPFLTDDKNLLNDAHLQNTDNFVTPPSQNYFQHHCSLLFAFLDQRLCRFTLLMSFHYTLFTLLTFHFRCQLQLRQSAYVPYILHRIKCFQCYHWIRTHSFSVLFFTPSIDDQHLPQLQLPFRAAGTATEILTKDITLINNSNCIVSSFRGARSN